MSLPICAVLLYMGNQYYIPDAVKQHIYTQTTLCQQITVAKRFRVSSRTVRCIVKNVHDHAVVSHKPLRRGRPRELSWDDVIVSQILLPSCYRLSLAKILIVSHITHSPYPRYISFRAPMAT